MAKPKHLLILANSAKHWPGTCVAGREIILTGDRYQIGPWIRPVSASGEGELLPSETRLQNGRQPAVLDFVEVHLSRAIGDPLQPENWLNDTETAWRSVNSNYEKPSLDLLREEPNTLWLYRNERCDRVSSTVLNKRPPGQSLYFIHVPSLRVRFEWSKPDGKFKKRRRALFNYRNVDYELGITDPKFSERYDDRFPPEGQPSKTFLVKPSSGCYLCVSLAPEFKGYHYKVAATIIEVL